MSQETNTANLSSTIEAEVQALELQNQLAAVVITDQPTYDAAVEARTKGKQFLKDANDWFDSIQKPAYEAYKGILDKRKQVCSPVEDQITAINRGLITWDSEQERLRQVEQRRLEEEARQAAEAERLEMAVSLETNGADAESVAELLSAPVAMTSAIVAPATYQKSKAVNYRDNFSAEITDFFALVKAVAKDKSKLNLLVGIAKNGDRYIPGPSLNQLAKALKETMSIPGCRVVNNKVVASGRG